MKLYLDDIRETPEGWERTYTAKETIEVLKTGKVEELSLDHDLNLAHYSGSLYDATKEETGYDVVLWMEEQAAVHKDFSCIPKIIHLHTANPEGRKRMLAGLNAIDRLKKQYENT